MPAPKVFRVVKGKLQSNDGNKTQDATLDDVFAEVKRKQQQAQENK